VVCLCRRHILHDSPGSSMRHGQRLFRPDNKEDRHACFCTCFVAVDSMVYEYTRPRGPIAAMYSSPGPCYGLPGLVGQEHHDPRSSHCRGPAYLFGVRHSGLTSDSSPGPCYLPDSKTYRNGRDGSPHYSLYARHRHQSAFLTGDLEPTDQRILLPPPGNRQLPRTASV